MSRSQLMTPEHVHAVQSPEHYAAMHQAVMTEQLEKRARFRNHARLTTLHLPFAVPPEMSPRVYIGAGKWLIRCICGNAPSVHPEWRMACCLECGAQYTDLAVPEDWQAIEAVLLKRPRRIQMNMRPDETLADLIAENLAHGDPV